MAELTWGHSRSPPDLSLRPVWYGAGPLVVACAPEAGGAPWFAPHVPWKLSSTSKKNPPPAAPSRENVGKRGSRGYTCAEGDGLPPPAGPGQPVGRSAKHDAHH